MSRHVEPTQLHQGAKDAMMAAIRPYADELGAQGMLAVVAQVTGMLIALQDCRTVTSDAVMTMVRANIESGNQLAVAQVIADAGGVQ